MLGAAGREFVIVVGMALILSFVVKTWLLQAFYIPSGSMEDTLVHNDRVIVSKLTPGPFELHRGDIVVFADPGDWLETVPEAKHSSAVTAIHKTLMFVGLLPDDAENHLIKRVIGLPGDRVACCDEGSPLTVNGVAINEPYLKPGDAPSSRTSTSACPRARCGSWATTARTPPTRVSTTPAARAATGRCRRASSSVGPLRSSGP